jgi:hypothetical protein
MIEPDSRFAAMGSSGMAVADNANASFWNPAGLAYQTNTQVGLTHANWLPEFNAGLFYEYLVGTYHIEGVGTFGGHVNFLNLGESERRDGAGNVLGEFRSYDLATGISYGRQLSERFAFGSSVRFIYSKLAPATGDIDSGTGVSASFDLSGLYRTAPFAIGGTDATFSAGFNASNLGPTITYDDVQESLPANLRLGYALTIDFDEYNTLTFTNDFTKMLVKVDRRLVSVDTTMENGETMVERTFEPDPDPFYRAIFSSWGPVRGTPGPDGEAETLSVLEQFTVGAGLEYWYNDLFAIRTGYFYEDPDNGNREFLTFGAGLRYNIIGVDVSYIYALAEDSPLANTLRFSVLLNFQKLGD